jgi:hypothetical protein
MRIRGAEVEDNTKNSSLPILTIEGSALQLTVASSQALTLASAGSSGLFRSPGSADTLPVDVEGW